MLERDKARAEPHPGPATAQSSFPTVATFGPFRLRAAERVLEKNGVPLKIGSRAFDVLVTLVERAPQVVSKRDLIARAWGALVVDEGSLRFHISALRKILGDGKSRTCYITNIPGRGYCFAAPVTSIAATLTRSEVAAPSSPAARLPKRPSRLLGRDAVVRDLTRQLREQRFVSIVGAGGIGKTTVALAVAHEMLAEFPGGVHFLDLAAITDPELIASALASQLGVSVVSENPLPAILSFLGKQRVLLLLDSCEHFIDPVATLAEELFRGAPQVHILATSQESLRTEGEWVHHLSPLQCPPRDSVSLTAAQALSFPAVQLFVEQVEASGHPLQLSDEDAPIVADLCRRLDGIPLALELAARYVGVYGVRGTASLLDQQFYLLRGRRTATPRHQTLMATLDWSHGLLSDTERLVLRRLAIFVGAFSLEAVTTVVGDDLDATQATETLARLVEKSLVTLDTSTAIRYRLLDTTRAYAAQKLAISGEQKMTARRHAEYVSSFLERLGAEISKRCSAESIDFFAAQIGNVRAALAWSLGDEGDGGIGVRLAAAAAPLFFQLCLLPECISWSECALCRLHPISEMRLELQLQTCFGISVLCTKGNLPVARAALDRALQLAQGLEDAASQLILADAIYRYTIRTGDFRELRDLTARCEAAARHLHDPLADALTHLINAVTCHHLGEHAEALPHARIAYSYPAHLSQLNAIAFGAFHPVGARLILARILWTLGYPDQAVEASQQGLKEAAALNNPPTTVYVLAWSVLLYLRTGDWQTAEELIQRTIAESTKYSLSMYAPIAMAWQGALAVRLGEPLRGIELLQTALTGLRAEGYELPRRILSGELAEGFLKAGQISLAHTAICEATEWAEAHGPSCDTPELLRIKGEVLISMAQSDTSDGERRLLDSLHLARDQRALSLELRTGMSLARHWAASGRVESAGDLLSSIYGRFSEGFETLDLVSAAKLLDELRIANPKQSMTKRTRPLASPSVRRRWRRRT